MATGRKPRGTGKPTGVAEERKHLADPGNTPRCLDEDLFLWHSLGSPYGLAIAQARAACAIRLVQDIVFDGKDLAETLARERLPADVLEPIEQALLDANEQPSDGSFAGLVTDLFRMLGDIHEKDVPDPRCMGKNLPKDRRPTRREFREALRKCTRS